MKYFPHSIGTNKVLDLRSYLDESLMLRCLSKHLASFVILWFYYIKLSDDLSNAIVHG